MMNESLIFHVHRLLSRKRFGFGSNSVLFRSADQPVKSQLCSAFFVIPSIFFLLILSYIYAVYGNVPAVSAIFDGFKAVVVAIVVEAVLKIAKKAFKSYWHVIISALSFVAIYFFQIPFPLIIIGAAIIGLITFKTQTANLKAEGNIAPVEDQ